MSPSKADTIIEGLKEASEDLMSESSLPVDRSYKSDGGKVFVSSRYIPEIGWYVFVEQDEKSMYREARKTLYFNLLITLAVSGILFFFSYRILRDFENRMESLAGTDALTGAANRRELIKQYDKFTYRMERYHSGLSLMLIDMDNFKSINDNCGHLTGDAVCQQRRKSFSELSVRPTL
jgi:hypothetical protein